MAEQKANPVNWFEIPSTDLDRAKKFYEEVFGFPMTSEELGPMKLVFFPMVNDVYGSAGALVKAEGYAPSATGIVVYFSVEDIEATLKKASAAGGKTLVPKMAIGEYGFVAHLADSEGNRIGLHSMN